MRALGAPAVVVSLALQGIFHGFKDTKTPVSRQVFGLTCKGGFLIGRTLAVLVTMTRGTSMAARRGTVAMAAHQTCLQVWLAVSLLTDALVASGQALIASSYSKGDYRTSREVANFALKVNRIAHKVSLAAILGLSFGSLATLFAKDAEVLGVVRTGVLFVSASQPVNALAFIFYGLHYGVSDFPYAACSMMVVGAICSSFLLYVPSIFGLHGVWAGLALFMGLRTLAGYIRISSKNGPWWFLHQDLKGSEWMTSQPPKPSCHVVITIDHFTITKAFVPRGHHRNLDVISSWPIRKSGSEYGVITNIIYGNLECSNGTDSRVESRIGFYQRYCSDEIFGVSTGDNLDCNNQRPFGFGLLFDSM
ncbi:unnamed protein product [Camellia sinensis]